MDTTKLNKLPLNIKVAESAEEIEAVRKFVIKNLLAENKSLIDYSTYPKILDDYDNSALQIFAETNNEIVASIRINLSANTEFSDVWNHNFGIDLFDSFQNPSFSFSSRLLVDNDWKGTAVLGKIVSAAYLIQRQKGIKFDLISCSPSLVQFYEHLGYRRYKDNFVDEELGYRVPMVLIVDDEEHFTKVRSPFLAQSKNFETSNVAANWFKQNFPAFIGITSERLMPLNQFWTFLANRLNEDIVPLLKGLGDEEVKRFLTSGVVLKVNKNDLIVRKGDIGNELFVLLSGSVEVRTNINNKNYSLAVMGKGEIFGEMAYLSHTERSADVVALEDCEVLVITQTFLKKAMKAMPETASKILFNLSLILCERLRTNNESFMAKLSSQPSE